MNFLRFFNGFVHGQIEDAGHGADWLADAFAGADKHWIDESIRRKTRLGDQVAKFGGTAKAAEARYGESHGVTGFES